MALGLDNFLINFIFNFHYKENAIDPTAGNISDSMFANSKSINDLLKIEKQ